MIHQRKLDHIRICLEEKVEAGDPGFGNYRLMHTILPEIDFSEVDLSTEFLGHGLDYPFLVEAMTGGSEKTTEINKSLAQLAQKMNIGFSVGSQRAGIEDESKKKTYEVRDVAEDVFLIGNLGAVQLNYGYFVEECEKAVEMINADALALHVNPLQEVVQKEGDRNFQDLIEKINQVSEELKTPVIVKSVGSGISKMDAKKLEVDALDTGGVGGTSWSIIEGFRDSSQKELGQRFAGWGLPTAECVKELSSLDKPLIASGGIRNGIDAAKCLALGADIFGCALPILRKWYSGGNEEVESYLEQVFKELRTALFLSGSKNVFEIRDKIEFLGE